ncbi:30S ribosomal protein S4 [candidate division WWE3 bacterium CG09_land_8_20_14_0_10_39_24]|uniref:Small ribosomal subunit protein uS4 n=2 Tax=Katanobacteria TaxID=422282 RepID=A0A2G9XCS3_UNCKA|nr:MAG: 30S ribosomal protein S4 [bacterium CG2_30_40_12]PIP04764.1 MAG: 30S ribosomal protein S4 [candidate division WWE3 bacterium CG23_combo_of_CG06-09_8_20_14_all_40_14]PIS12797.1 MAG: 30S ribosomal protein S4 [candidate division WWE3 bacterium CG09_land_8_20_14_0_10_39_24]PJE50810.1 MAG: 30S ribosomal protein S4 [candidate division WWE3 bacterium CG10_big_fil_rev_8_21_14_0_10_39_14]
MTKIYLGPKCRLCRREGAKLFLKGARCLSEKCAITKHAIAPGQHGARRKRVSSFGIHLREKQKVKRIYNLSDRQFRNYYKKAAKRPGVTGLYLLQILETRLDNVVYRLGLAESRRHSRLLVGQGKFLLNDKNVKTPSIIVSVGDVIKVANEKGVSLQEDREMPVWIKWSKKAKEGKIARLPEREDIEADIDEQLIVEFYSR